MIDILYLSLLLLLIAPLRIRYHNDDRFSNVLSIDIFVEAGGSKENSKSHLLHRSAAYLSRDDFFSQWRPVADLEAFIAKMGNDFKGILKVRF